MRRGFRHLLVVYLLPFLHTSLQSHIALQTLHTKRQSDDCACGRTCRIVIHYQLVQHNDRQPLQQQYYNPLLLSIGQPMRQCVMACGPSDHSQALVFEEHRLLEALAPGMEIIQGRDSTGGKVLDAP